MPYPEKDTSIQQNIMEELARAKLPDDAQARVKELLDRLAPARSFTPTQPSDAKPRARDQNGNWPPVPEDKIAQIVDYMRPHADPDQLAELVRVARDPNSYKPGNGTDR